MEPLRPWIEPDRDAADSGAQLAGACDLPAALGRVLWARGHREPQTVRRLLEPTHDHLLDPGLMAGMPAAAARLERARRDGEHVVVQGDYDADGVSGTALLVSNLRAAGMRADFFIPDRERDGYGITPRLVERAAQVGVRVLVSVDCGSSDHAVIETAGARGVDVIVVDHHEIPSPPPAACAVLNPKRDDCSYPFKGLSAVGVGYKLLQALAAERSDPNPPDGLDFVALGTLADSQPVTEENRTLVALGLRRLSDDPRPGIRALRDAAGVVDAVGTRAVGWRLVPRLNAVGRVARGKLAVDLLLAADGREAARFAAEMEVRNRERQGLEQAVTEAAVERAEAILRERRPAALVLASDAWHPGVVGIAAARLVDRFGIPAAVIGIQNGAGRGSVRTTGGVDVKAALDAAADCLVRHGGHREAAGFTIEPERIAAFATRFEAAVDAQRRDTDPRAFTADAWLHPEEVGVPLAAALDKLEPFGVGHPEPLFIVVGLHVGPATRIVGDGHLKLDLVAPSGRAHDGIAFGRASSLRPADAIGRTVDVLAHVRRQDPRWGSGAQLVVRDLRPAEPASDGGSCT